jgi:uncharacterized protein YcfJ
MHTSVKLTLLAAGCVLATQAAAQITFYDGEGYSGRSFTTTRSLENLERYGFNDRAASAVVARDRWEVCDDAHYKGHCTVLRPGRYPSLAAMGLDDRISSLRVMAQSSRVDEHRYAPAPMPMPAPAPTYDYRRRDGERVYEAQVTSVRAVVASRGQHCWMEREEVHTQDSGANVPGAVIGGILGGILGHQVGGGRGQDVATVGGAVAGAVAGANVGRDRGAAGSQDVQRCSETRGDVRPEYWDVTYDFRGREHRVQLTAPPGDVITVNEQGEPRG